MKIREATSEDIAGIAYVHAESWKTTYRGIVSDEFLDQITVEGRKKLWTRVFASPNKDEVMYVAQDETGQIIGLANGGARKEPDEYDAELYALYLLKEHQGKGIGKQLIRSVVQKLIEQEYSSFMTWVLAANPAINFYHRMGGESVAREMITIGNESLEEVKMGWKDIQVIL